MKALIEAQIPIDMIGGTSIGSFMGALYADGLDLDEVDKRARTWSMVYF
jgi:lysophospholipid hydrolase